MKRFSAREALLILAPVAALAGFGWLLRARPPAVVTVVNGPFQPFIRRVQLLPARPVDVFDGYDTRVLIELDAHGRKPAWWLKGFGGYSLYDDAGQLVLVQKGALKSLRHGGYCEAPHFDSKSGYWITEYRLKLRDVAPQAGQIRLRDTIKITDNSQKRPASLWLDTPVRASGMAVKIPLFSRVPVVKLESFQLSTTPPIDSHDGVERLRVKWHFFKNISPAEAQTNHDSINRRIYIVNRKGQHVGRADGSEYGGFDNDTLVYHNESEDPRRPSIREDFALNGFLFSGMANVSPREPLWLQGDARSGDGWPLFIRIPLRDSNGRNLFPPRTPTVPFQVLSISKVASNTEETTDYGADSTVQVVLKAWNPKADVSTWKWEINYSQHLRAAVGPLLWELAFKTGKTTIGANWSYSGNRMTLRFPLVLKGIPAKSGKLVFHTDIAANQSRRVPVETVVRP